MFERKAIEKLTEADLDKIPVPAPYGASSIPGNCATRRLRRCAPGSPPESRKAKTNCRARRRATSFARCASSQNKVGIRLNGGAVDRGEMARVDVFRKANKKGVWQYYLVPIYPHEIATMDAPPMRAVVAYKDEGDWAVMDSTFEFLWSIDLMVLLEVVKTSGKIVDGYFRGLHRTPAPSHLSSTTIPRKWPRHRRQDARFLQEIQH